MEFAWISCEYARKFPEPSWSEFHGNIASGRYNVAIDRTRAVDVVNNFGTSFQRFWLALLLFTPIWSGAAIVAMAVAWKNYWLLTSLIAIMPAQFLAARDNMNPGMGLLKILVAIGLAVVLDPRSPWGLACLTAGLQLLTRKIWYKLSVAFARGPIENNEEVFLRAFAANITSVIDTQSGNRIWAKF